MPEVSVIIPFYTGVDWLSEAVDSNTLSTASLNQSTPV